MSESLKHIAKKLLPGIFVKSLSKFRWWIWLELTRIKLSANRWGPCLLGYNELELLQLKYPIVDGYKYDDERTLNRGRERMAMLLEFPGAAEVHTFLEVGCGDSMVTAMLYKAKK